MRDLLSVTLAVAKSSRQTAEHSGQSATEAETEDEGGKVDAVYGALLADTADSMGLTGREVAKLAGYKGGEKDLTLWRLKTGKGSFASARAVRKVLVAKGAVLPPVPIPGEEPSPPPKPEPRWRQNWVVLGEVLHKYATEEQFMQLVIELRKLAEAHQRVKLGITAVSYPLPWNDPEGDRGGG